MNQNLPAQSTQTERFIFRVFFLYFIFYFLFISNFLSEGSPIIPLLEYVNKPFQFISLEFISLVNKIFLHKSFKGDIYITDTYWSLIAVLSFLLLAIIIAVVWTFLQKRKNHLTLFNYLHILARYYLSFVLFGYGIDKLFEHQFLLPPWPTSLIKPVSEMDSHTLFWVFMGVSKSYNLFAGILETTAAILILFRRTCTIGAFVSLVILVNTLLLNIGYDTPIKLFLLNLVFISIFILTPNLKRLFKFFFTKQAASLFIMPSAIENKKYKWVQYVLKFTLILFFIFSDVKGELDLGKQIANSPQSAIVGIHEIKEFTWNAQQPNINSNSLYWKKIAINPLWRVAVQFMNDSVAIYNFNTDKITNSLQLFSWNDSSFKCSLHYTKISSTEWLFEGSLKKDFIRFISKKIDLSNHTLIKSIGKVKWLYD